MKSFEARVVVAAVVLTAVLGLLIFAIYRNTVRRVSDAEYIAKGMINLKNQLDTAREAAEPDTAQMRARIHELTVEGEENRDDVYLQSLDIAVEVTGNVASTRYTMVVKNRTDRVLESIITFPLPNENATVTYYALDVDGKMREAVPVESKGDAGF